MAAVRTDDELLAELSVWVHDNWSPDLTLAEWWRRLALAGWAFPDWPTEYLGRGLPRMQSIAVASHLVSLGVLGAPQGVGQLWGAQTLLAHGTDQQKAAFLPALASGQEEWCQLFSEPDAGSDLAGVRTTAARIDHGDWVVNGVKVWTTAADRADRGLLLARTDPGAPKRSGITYFVIDMQQPGIEVNPIVQMDGHARFMQVTMSDARVSDDRIVGNVNDGWRVARTTLQQERLLAGARRPTGIVAVPGSRSGALERRVADVVEEERTSVRPAGRALGTQSLIALAAEHGRLGEAEIRHRVVEHFMVASVHKWNRSRAQADARAGRRTGAEEAIAKLTISKLSQLSRDHGLAVMGADGMLLRSGSVLDRRVQEVALSSPSTSIAGGTDEIQKNLIAERVLGLPRESEQ